MFLDLHQCRLALAGPFGTKVTVLSVTEPLEPHAVKMIRLEYISGFYNLRRKHSALGWKSPATQPPVTERRKMMRLSRSVAAPSTKVQRNSVQMRSSPAPR